MISMNK